MTLALIALLFAFLIAFGRQSAVFGKIKKALWFFHHFETKRLIFTMISVTLGMSSLLLFDNTYGVLTIFIISVSLILFSFFFDMKYFFPEINKVEKSRPKNLNPQLSIIGVQLGAISIAYPLDDVVIPRHLINDKLNDTPILISYCALCKSALAFKSEVGNSNLYFKVAGVWRRNMIIYDTETYSLWQQATGECIYGKLKGEQLELISGENTTFGEWQTKHPDTFFATKCIEARKGYLSRETMLKGINFITPKVTVPGYSDLSDLPVREMVFGITFNGVSKAYPKKEIEDLHLFSDRFANKSLNLEYNKSSEYLTATDAQIGKQIIVEKHWWLGWKEFHPNTEIWKKEDGRK